VRKYAKTFWDGFKEGVYAEATRMMPLNVILCLVILLLLLARSWNAASG
jgi:hypothetical protein